MTIDTFISTMAEELEIEQELTPETVFTELPMWSSLSMMELIVLIDREFHKSFTLSQIMECKTIQDLYNKASA